MNSVSKIVFLILVLYPVPGFGHSTFLTRPSPTPTPRNDNVVNWSSINSTRTLTEGVNELGDQIANGLLANQKRRIAVVEFVDLKGTVTDLGRYVSEKLITRLFLTGRFTVIERQLLNKIISEQKLSLTGIIDPGSAQKLGKLLGVDAIATGSITDLTKTLEVNARLISTETGEVFSAASIEVLKDETTCNLMGGCNRNNQQIPQTQKGQNGQNTDIPSGYQLINEDGVWTLKKTQSGERVKEAVPRQKSWVVQQSFFTFELQRCRLSGTNVICDLTITNNDRDRELELVGGYDTRIFDDSNNESRATSAELANSGQNTYADAFLVNSIPTKARIYFGNVSTNAGRITLLSIQVCPRGGWASQCFSVQYRNIPLN